MSLEKGVELQIDIEIVKKKNQELEKRLESLVKENEKYETGWLFMWRIHILNLRLMKRD